MKIDSNNFQPNTSVHQIQKHVKGITPQPSAIYPGNIRLVKYLKIIQCNQLYLQTNKKKNP